MKLDFELRDALLEIGIPLQHGGREIYMAYENCFSPFSEAWLATYGQACSASRPCRRRSSVAGHKGVIGEEWARTRAAGWLRPEDGG